MKSLKINLPILQKKHGKINILLAGATGCGKSSTINALFGKEVSKVGVTPDPETMEIDKYILPGVVLWDTPGLGDSEENDKRHSKNIIKKIQENKDGKGLIDIVLVIVDGSNRDMKTAFYLINEVIIPHFDKNRILVAINKVDGVMSGKYWDRKTNSPTPQLQKFIEDKELSVRDRIKKDTSVDIWPISYVAGDKDIYSGVQEQPYNLLKLLYELYMRTPPEKRAAYAKVVNSDPKAWKTNDGTGYGTKIKEDFVDRLQREVEECGDIGCELGGKFGEFLRMETAGRVVGGITGMAVGACKAILSSLWPF